MLVLWTALVWLGLSSLTVHAHNGSTRPLFGPYKHVNMAMLNDGITITGQYQGQTQALSNGKQSILPKGVTALSLAFASGECAEEHWGGIPAQKLIDANLQKLADAGIPYIISTGGEGGVFTCNTDAGFERFLSRYASPALLGFDFDIEATQTEAMIFELVRRVQVAEATHPAMRFSFTLATFASSDGSGASLNATGNTVLQALQNIGVKNYIINLMVMNYGPAERKNCVVRKDRCDMAASAEQAVKNLQAGYKLPTSQIAVTAMLGVNDVASNVFTQKDAKRLARYASRHQLAGLHYWSLDRDKPCDHNATNLSPVCSSLNTVPFHGFMQAFLRGLR